jgi:hypothetical protein
MKGIVSSSAELAAAVSRRLEKGQRTAIKGRQE